MGALDVDDPLGQPVPVVWPAPTGGGAGARAAPEFRAFTEMGQSVKGIENAVMPQTQLQAKEDST